MKIKFVAKDEFGIVDGSGWVIVDADDNRIDWPMMTTKKEALQELADMKADLRQLADDEASEAAYFARIADHVDGYDRDDLGESPDY